MRDLAIIVVALLFALPAGAEEKPFLYRYLESLPSMSEVDRILFDKAAKSMYRKDCECLTFLFEGKVWEFTLPLNDADRRLLIRSLIKGIIIPFGPAGQGS